MTLTTDKVHDGMDLIGLLSRNTEETSSCHSNQPWATAVHDALSPQQSGADDFLAALLGGGDPSSASPSPLWSPCTTDSGVYDDPTEGPHTPSCKQFAAFDTHSAPQPPSNETTSDVSIDLGWECGGLQEQLGIAYYLTTTNQSCPLLSSQTLTVKDLLLSNLGQETQRIPQNSLRELVLNEDEKTLLAKEGVNLPTKLPLSKSEERVLKKIRRKIRNKHSAQESRKKKREYVDSLEGRMSVCSARNLQLQRKIQQLEETNNALLEQLSHMQALLPNSAGKTTHPGTCILPEPYSQLSKGKHADTKVPSGSQQSMDEVHRVPASSSPLPLLSVSGGFQSLRSLAGKVWPRLDLPTADFPPSQRRDHRHRNH